MACDTCDEIIDNGCSCDNGLNAFTITTQSYVQPAVNTNVTISVSNSNGYTGSFAVPGQIIYVQNGGYYTVQSSTATTIIMQYGSDYTTFNQALTASGLTVATNKKVSPGGLRGIAGSNGTNGKTLIDIDYSERKNTTTAVQTLDTISLGTALYFQNNGDSIEFECLLSRASTSNNPDNSYMNIETKQGVTYINLIRASNNSIAFNTVQKIKITATRISATQLATFSSLSTYPLYPLSPPLYTYGPASLELLEIQPSITTYDFTQPLDIVVRGRDYFGTTSCVYSKVQVNNKI
tara:strand:- start:18 stop:896 length:879 start_codon:yes stop_codon:yes gene_type:complete